MFDDPSVVSTTNWVYSRDFKHIDMRVRHDGEHDEILGTFSIDELAKLDPVLDFREHAKKMREQWGMK